MAAAVMAAAVMAAVATDMSALEHLGQLMLDLFGAASAQPAAPRAAVQPPAPRLASPTLQPPLRHYAHPQATHAIRLGETCVAWRLRRSARRSIGFVVDELGLTVSAPRWTQLPEIEAALHSKARWVLSKLAQAQERQQRQHAARIPWGEGATLPWLGQTLTLRREPRAALNGPARPRWQAAADSVADADRSSAAGPALYLSLPPAATAAQWRDVTQAWIKQQARRHFTARLDHFAPLMGVRWQKMALTSASTRWGSASADGSIRLNWRLMHFRPAVVDYVVVHELAHLHEMNHSPRFWAHVQAQLPAYAALRAELRGEALPLW